MSSLDLGALVTDRLDASAEKEWERMRSQIALADGFWLGFVFSSAVRAIDELRARVRRALSAQHKSLLERVLTRPEELQKILPWLLTAPEPANAGCTWIEAIRSDPPGAAESPWASAWDQFFLRANEHRDALRSRLRGGLIFACTHEIKPLIREAAPDFWSVRSLVIGVIDVAPESSSSPGPHRETTLMTLPIPGVDRTISPVESADPAFAVAEAQRRGAKDALLPRGRAMSASQGQALLQAAEGFLAEGQVAEAWDAAGSARDLLRGADMLGESRAFWLLAETEIARSELAKAAEHVERAIAVRRTYAPDNIPIEWYDMAGRLALARGDRSTAASMYREAELSARRRLQVRESIDALHDLLVTLLGLGDVRRESGDFTRAMAAFESTVIAARKLHQVRGDVARIVHILSFALLKLGDLRVALGDVAGAVAAFDEALAFDRQLYLMRGETPHTLRSLSIFLNRAGHARRNMGDGAGSAAAFEEALTLRRRILAVYGENPRALRDLSSSLIKVGDARCASGELKGASTAFQEALDIDSRLVETLGRTPDTLRDLAVSLYKNGQILRTIAEDAFAAAVMFRRCVDTAQELLTISNEPLRDRSILTDAIIALEGQDPKIAAAAAAGERRTML